MDEGAWVDVHSAQCAFALNGATTGSTIRTLTSDSVYVVYRRAPILFQSGRLVRGEFGILFGFMA